MTTTVGRVLRSELGACLLGLLACSREREEQGAPAVAAATALPSTGAASRPYFIRLTGDGAPLELRDGAPRPPLPVLNLEPAAVVDPVGLIVSACADRTRPVRSCIWIRGEASVYYDRNGELFHLVVKRRDVRESPGVLDGSFSLAGTATDGGRALELEVTFHVNTQVASVDAPGVWKRSGPWAEL